MHAVRPVGFSVRNGSNRVFLLNPDLGDAYIPVRPGGNRISYENADFVRAIGRHNIKSIYFLCVTDYFSPCDPCISRPHLNFVILSRPVR